MNGEVVVINPRKERIFGFEPRKNIILIDALIKGIQAGDNIPPANMEYDGKNYFIEPGQSGGHHRTLAYIIEGISMPIKISGGYTHILFEEEYFPIENTKLYDHREEGQGYEKEEFHVMCERGNYPRIDWEGWNLLKRPKWAKRFT